MTPGTLAGRILPRPGELRAMLRLAVPVVLGAGGHDAHGRRRHRDGRAPGARRLVGRPRRRRAGTSLLLRHRRLRDGDADGARPRRGAGGGRAGSRRASLAASSAGCCSRSSWPCRRSGSCSWPARSWGWLTSPPRWSPWRRPTRSGSLPGCCRSSCSSCSGRACRRCIGPPRS